MARAEGVKQDREWIGVDEIRSATERIASRRSVGDWESSFVRESIVVLPEFAKALREDGLTVGSIVAIVEEALLARFAAVLVGPVCRTCGCSEQRACVELASGACCSWSEPDLCSACAASSSGDWQHPDPFDPLSLIAPEVFS